MSISRIAAASGFSPDWVVKYSSYSGDSLDVSAASVSGSVSDMFFKPDGLSLYIISSDSKVFQYDLTVPWDITTGSYSKTATVAGGLGLYIKPDGTRMYVRSTTGIHQYSLSVAWDISTRAFMSTGSVSSDLAPGLWFSSDGSYVFYPYTDFPFLEILKRLLSTPWSISSLTSTFATGYAGGWGFYFSDDERYLAFCNASSSTVSVYQDRALLSSYNASAQDSFFTSVFFKDPRTFYLLGRTSDFIYKYDIA